jgi:hypothetical protein
MTSSALKTIIGAREIAWSAGRISDSPKAADKDI